MPKKMMKKSVYLGVFILFLSFVVSCEKDFTDIGTSVINNTKFDTKEIYLDIEMSKIDVDFVRADNLTLGNLGEYLLGVYKKSKGNEKKVEASIISQLSLPLNLTIYAADLEDGQTLSAANIDEVILKIPLKATRTGVETAQIDVNGVSKDTVVPVYKIDSILGDASKDFTLNVYQSNTFLNRLNPNNPAELNSFESNTTYQPLGAKLNLNATFNFSSIEKDTLFVFERTLSTGATYKDTIKVENGSVIKSNPFISIKLDKARIKSILFDKYEDTELSTQDQLNNYFRGIIIEATGTDGAMLPIDLSTNKNLLRPSIDIIHTSTILDSNNNVLDTIAKVDSFYLGGIGNSVYKTTAATNSASNTIVVQGTAGSYANIKVLGVNIANLDEQTNPYIFSLKNTRNTNNDGYLSLDELVNVENNDGILINDVSLQFYINKNTAAVDTTNIPKRLFLYKNGTTIKSQIRDVLTDGPSALGGGLILSGAKPEAYKFKITEYISYLLEGRTNYLPDFGLKVYNPTDTPSNVNDTIVDSYNWNPRSAPILDENTANGARRARIKISYTIKK